MTPMEVLGLNSCNWRNAQTTGRRAEACNDASDFDRVRMDNALASQKQLIPQGLTPEEIRLYIIRAAVAA